MSTNLYAQAVSGNPISAADWNSNFLLTQHSIADLGPLLISGLVPSAGVGLSVTVTAGVASIGGRITASGSFSIAGLANNTLNHLYMLDSGAGTSNTTGTAPADSVKLGTATTVAGSVTAVAVNWASGRQTKRRTEDLVHGSGAGHPRAVNLASWHASNNEGNETKGTLPAGAMPAVAFDDLSDVTLTSQARGDIVYRNATVWANLPAGTSGQVFRTNGAGADPAWASSVAGLTFTSDITLSTVNIVTDTATGTKIGTGTTQRLGFFNATPVPQQTGASAAGIAAIIDPNAQAAVSAIQTALAALGIVTSPA